MKPSTAKPKRSGAKTPATVYVVDGDSALSYLLERYANRGGFGFCEVHIPWQSRPSLLPGSAALWLPSLERLESVNPRDEGIGEDLPVIVCSFAGDEARAHELGADFCAFDPLSYEDFLAALRAVGIVDSFGMPGNPGVPVEQGSES
jgi:hypothetical protein